MITTVFNNTLEAPAFGESTKEAQEDEGKLGIRERSAHSLPTADRSGAVTHHEITRKEASEVHRAML